MTTLADFFTQIRGFTGFTDPTVQTDALLLSWLRMAEERCDSDLRVRDMIKIATVESYEGEAELPEDFREATFVGVQSSRLILEFSDFQDFYADEGPAGKFAYSGPTLFIGGNVSDTIDLHYFADVPRLTAEGSTWLSEKYLTIITGATLAIAFMSMQEPERAAQWNAAAKGRIEKVNQEYLVAKTAGSRLRRRLNNRLG